MDAAELLLKKGHRKILLASANPKSTSTLTERAEGFQQAHIRYGISLSADNFMIDLKSPVSRNCAEALKESGKSFPKDCEIICFDRENSFLPRSDYTHILQNEEKMGKVCVEQLMKKIQKENVTMRNIIESKLVIGNSTKR